MFAKNNDLHGSVPDKGRVALLLIDLINDFEYPGGADLFAQAMPTAERILALKLQARRAGIPVIYVNDNFGKWRSDFRKLVAHCLEDTVRGEPLARLLKPDDEDYFVLKPKHSAFFSTTLDLLLQYLKANTLILTGLSGDMCVLFTASDAYMRDLHLVVPADCVASIEPQANCLALEQMRRLFQADIRPSTEHDLEVLMQKAHR
ncbi:MAG TPA: isochorismatase family cysteine hydrolase [Roseiflexaceae bacterium]|nr:isochorismatase family cysteine hydrolase [Roseiflexaceae bacterium]